MTPPRSRTHDIAFLQQDNGELQEDVVARDVTGGPEADRSMEPSGANRRPPAGATGQGTGQGDADADPGTNDAEVDEEVAESFPASDPPSYWSGGARRPHRDETGEGQGATTEAGSGATAKGRVVGRSHVEDVPERRRPDEPLPGSLPRPTGPGTDEDRD